MNTDKYIGIKMEYETFKAIFDNKIFGKAKADLVRKLAMYPERYVGQFRPTKPRDKVIQNLSQSREIRFGDAFEILIERYLKEVGFDILEKRLHNNKRKDLLLDQLFTDGKTIFFAEQKMRDDHDSSKKRGQIENFEKKISAIKEKYRDKEIVGFFYFIDNSFEKNRKFYAEEIPKLEVAYKIKLHLSYGPELFTILGKDAIWPELIKHLEKWKEGVPEFWDENVDAKVQENFDKDHRTSSNEMKELKVGVLKKLFANSDLDAFLPILFPDGNSLDDLHQWFQDEQKKSKGKKQKSLEELIELSDAAIKRLKDRSPQ